MANTFKNASIAVADTATTIYTCPSAAGSSAVVFTFYLANISNDMANVTVQVYDASATASRTVGKDIPIPPGSTLNFGKIALEPSDELRAYAQYNGDIDAFANVLEITP